MGRGGRFHSSRANHQTAIKASGPGLRPGQIPQERFWRSQANLCRIRRQVALILQFAQDLHATSSVVQHIPNAQQDCLSVSSPLMVPKPELLNPVGIQKSFSREVALPLIRKAVSEAVEFDRKASLCTIEIERKRPERMLTAELKSRESTGTQRLPQLPFLWGLFPSEPPNIAGRIHGLNCRSYETQRNTLIDYWWELASSPQPSPPEEEREIRRVLGLSKRSCRDSRLAHLNVEQ
jgi:hypothetical protein